MSGIRNFLTNGHDMKMGREKSLGLIRVRFFAKQIRPLEALGLGEKCVGQERQRKARRAPLLAGAPSRKKRQKVSMSLMGLVLGLGSPERLMSATTR
jgi:hypothetical protein